MLSVVCWKWHAPGAPKVRQFTARHVNVFRNMVERHYSGEHQVVCVTDDPEGIDPRVRTVRLRDYFTDLQNTLGPDHPSCYRRLFAFHPDFAAEVGDRFVSVDLDCVIVGDMRPLWDRPEDIVFWQSPIRSPAYNGSMWLVRTGSHPELFSDFGADKVELLTRLREERRRKREPETLSGSDQAWFSHRLPNEAFWSKDDGVWAWHPSLKNYGWFLPPNARIVFFCGREKPWDKSAMERGTWIEQHYR